MSTGKPIVLFYSEDSDSNVSILRKYPLCLFLRQDDALIQENVEKLVKFCRETKERTMNFAEVERIYYTATPEYVTKQMVNAIDE
jgi:hypothetical protein